jgi:replicative DNA helicase
MESHKPLTIAPHALNMSEVYHEALRELTTPFPAITVDEWPSFSKLTGGFRKREFTILCGATGSGKTTLLANLSAMLLKQRVKHFVMSVETGHTDFMKRIISVLHGADLNTGDPIHPDVLMKVHRANAEILESDTIEFSLYEDRLSVEQLKADILWMVENRGCGIVFIDNLNFFMEVTSAKDAVSEMDRVIHELIIFCKQVDVHLVMVMHPKKNDKGSRLTSEFDIKGSSTSVQEAHNVLLFNRPEASMIESGARSPYDRELLIQKMRRRGVHTGKTIIFENHGTRYIEKGLG